MKKKVFKVFSILLLVACIVCLSFFGYWWYFQGGETYYRYTYHKDHEPFTFSRKTSTDALYSNDRLKDMLSSYFDEETLDVIIENSYIIPGLKASETLAYNHYHQHSICTSMTPQGVTMSDEYVFISAYCQTKEHNSIIYQIDRETHELIQPIVLPDKSHVGSVAYDDVYDNLWVCCFEEENKVAFVCSISMSAIDHYTFNQSYCPILYTKQYPIDTMKRSSFMTYHDGSLYVGYFSSSSEASSTVQEFQIQEDGGLKYTGNLMNDIYEDEPDSYVLPNSLFYINGLAQGVAVSEDHIYITQSHGSDNDSVLSVFANKEDEEGNVNATDANKLYSFHLPCMAEDCYMDDENNLYVCFESAGYAYRARKSPHVDRILFLPAEFLSDSG